LTGGIRACVAGPCCARHERATGSIAVYCRRASDEAQHGGEQSHGSDGDLQARHAFNIYSCKAPF
jgi:hypothetical protein